MASTGARTSGLELTPTPVSARGARPGPLERVEATGAAAKLSSAPQARSERRILWVSDDARAEYPVTRALLGVQARFERVRPAEVARRNDLHHFGAACFDCPGSPAKDVAKLAEAVADESVPVVLALFETDLALADERTFRKVRSVLVRPYRDCQFVAALRCALADTAARPTFASMVAEYGLSQREAGIVKALVGGYRVPALAQQLGLSPHTVRNQLKSVFRKCSVHSQWELLTLARRVVSGE
jgi:DNA-binding NarL/FixJ family response regulator